MGASSPNLPGDPAMKHMNETERALAFFGVLLASVALVLALSTEITARRHLAEYQRLIAAGAPATLDAGKPSYLHHIGFEKQTLAGRWSFPDGHAALGAFAALFGMVLFAVPQATARKRTTL